MWTLHSVKYASPNKINVVWFYLHEMFRIVQCIETENVNTMVVARGWK